MKYKLLIVDDEPPSLRKIKRCILEAGVNFEIVAEASNGEMALRKVRQASPDVIVTDILMPVTNGLDLIEQCKSFNKDIRAVILSGYSEFEYAKRALRLDVKDYLLKPIDVPSVKEVLKRIHAELESEHFTRADA